MFSGRFSLFFFFFSQNKNPDYSRQINDDGHLFIINYV